VDPGALKAAFFKLSLLIHPARYFRKNLGIAKAAKTLAAITQSIDALARAASVFKAVLAKNR
jgi:hypothetical protein